MARPRIYSDEDLADAIARSESWRGTLRELGLAATSSGAMRSVRSHADSLGIDYGHFRPPRGWDEHQLRDAIAAANAWPDVATSLGAPASTLGSLRGHASRLGIDTTHLGRHSDLGSELGTSRAGLRPDLSNLGRAGSLIAAAWFTMCGCDVSWPLEASRYDLLVNASGALRRVQVKTTVTRIGKTWKVFLSTSRGGRRTYEPDEIDDFFIVDGDFNVYVIPIVVVGGLHAIHLHAYSAYRAGSLPRASVDDVPAT
jgi:hypothetical protein